LKSFIKVVLIFATLSSLSLYGKNLESRKERILERLDRKIELLNRFKSCVVEAKSGKELKSCRSEYKSAIRDLKEEYRNSKNRQKRDQHK